MKYSLKSTGWSLMIGSFLLVATMVLHPTHVEDHSTNLINIVAHSLAILSMPFCLYGFWGLTMKFNRIGFFPGSGLAVMTIGLIAGMMAAAINGLAVTFFLNRYDRDAVSPETIDIILEYSFALNNALSYVLIGAVMISILFWSIEILRTHVYPRWLGFYGVILTVIAIVLFMTGYDFMSVAGFRLVVFGMVSWIIISGYWIVRTSGQDEKVE